MATRLYLSNLSVEITPGFEAWQESANAVRGKMLAATTIDPLASTGIATTTPGNTTLHRQLISDPLVAGITFTSGVSTFTCQILGRESATNDNIINRVRALKVISRDGGTVRATLIALGNAASIAEWLNTGLRNLTFLNATTAGATYTTEAGDRLCLEVGHDDSGGSSITGTLRFGADSTGTGDLAVNETDTTLTLRPWLESSVNLTFESSLDDGHDDGRLAQLWPTVVRRLGTAALAATLLAGQTQLTFGNQDEIAPAEPGAISEDYFLVLPIGVPRVTQAVIDDDVVIPAPEFVDDESWPVAPRPVSRGVVTVWTTDDEIAVPEAVPESDDGQPLGPIPNRVLASAITADDEIVAVAEVPEPDDAWIVGPIPAHVPPPPITADDEITLVSEVPEPDDAWIVGPIPAHVSPPAFTADDEIATVPPAALSEDYWVVCPVVVPASTRAVVRDDDVVVPAQFLPDESYLVLAYGTYDPRGRPVVSDDDFVVFPGIRDEGEFMPKPMRAYRPPHRVMIGMGEDEYILFVAPPSGDDFTITKRRNPRIRPR